MAKYILFDKLCETSYTPAFLNTAKELATLLDISLETRNDFKFDLGLNAKALDSFAFHKTNAYNLSLAANAHQEIVCAEQSSFLSLCLTKQALINDEELANQIKNSLEIPLNTEAKINYFNDILLDNKEKLENKIINPFQAFRAAIYYGSNANRLARFSDISSTDTLLELIQAKNVKFATCKDSNGYEIEKINTKVAHHLAGDILLDAFDNAADFLITNDITALNFFDANQKEISKEMGRDINLSIFSISQLLLLACGKTDKKLLGLNLFKTKITLL
jgi:succinate dehydrogenase / fumarate reductase cytochrome b subunit